MASEEFGALKQRSAILFDGGSIEALESIEETLVRFEKKTHPDGFYYPPMQHTVTESRRGQEVVNAFVPKSERPAHLFWVPATHRVTVSAPIESDFKRGDAGFLIHLAGYLWGTRVQFADWQVDGRVPFTRSTHGAIVMGYHHTPFFSVAYNTWKAWPAGRRRMMTNALFVHSRAPSYDWKWEQFLIEYTVFDNLWKQLALPECPHAKRIEKVCAHFGMDFDATAAKGVVDLRNNLVHEGIWEGDTPGFAMTQHGWDSANRLRSLTHKVISTALGWSGEYSRSSWANCSMTELFD